MSHRSDEWIKLQGQKLGGQLYHKVVADKDFDELNYSQTLLLFDEIYAEATLLVYKKKKKEQSKQ